MQKLDRKPRKKHLEIHHRLTNHIISMAAPPDPENKLLTPKSKNLNFSNKFFRNMMKKKEYKLIAREASGSLYVLMLITPVTDEISGFSYEEP